MRIIREQGGSQTRLPERLVLKCHKKINEDGNAFEGRTDVYGIMDGNKPSPTITGGCLCYSKGRYGHYAQDMVVKTDEAGNVKPDKAKSTEKIDGAVALIMALDIALKGGGEPKGCIYDYRDLIII